MGGSCRLVLSAAWSLQLALSLCNEGGLMCCSPHAWLEGLCSALLMPKFGWYSTQEGDEVRLCPGSSTSRVTCLTGTLGCAC